MLAFLLCCLLAPLSVQSCDTPEWLIVCLQGARDPTICPKLDPERSTDPRFPEDCTSCNEACKILDCLQSCYEAPFYDAYADQKTKSHITLQLNKCSSCTKWYVEPPPEDTGHRSAQPSAASLVVAAAFSAATLAGSLAGWGSLGGGGGGFGGGGGGDGRDSGSPSRTWWLESRR